MPSLFVREDLRRYTTTYPPGTDIAAACRARHVNATIADNACYYLFRLRQTRSAPQHPLQPQIRPPHPYILFKPGEDETPPMCSTAYSSLHIGVESVLKCIRTK